MTTAKSKRKKRINSRLINGLKPEDSPFEITDDALPGFIVRVQPSGSMTYYARYRVSGGRKAAHRRARIGSADRLTPDQARAKAKTLLSQAGLGEDPAREEQSKRAIPTLREFVDSDYGKWVKASRKSGEATVKRIDNLFDHLMSHRIDQITPKQIQLWQAESLKAGKKASTINREFTIILALLNKAVEWGTINQNPIARVKRLKEDSAPKVRYLTREEESRLLAALDEREERIRTERDSHIAWQLRRGQEPSPSLRGVEFADYLKPMVLVSLHTGLRRGELFSLEWSDVNFDMSFLTVQGTMAKSGNTRHIPLNSVALSTLKKWYEQSETSGLVFPNKDGERFDNVDTAWEAVLDEAKIQDVTWHTMRHTFASNLVMSGVDLYTVQKLLGHSNIKITERYSHLSPQVKIAAVERLVAPAPDKVIPFVRDQEAHSDS